MRRDFRLCAWLYGFAPGLLLALLFLFPQAAMQGVKDGLLLWTQAVLPALLPFFVVTSLLQSAPAEYCWQAGSPARRTGRGSLPHCARRARFLRMPAHA